MKNSNLFKPIKLGKIKLEHRIVHAPTSRSRSAKGFIPTDIMLEYYSLRSQFAGTLIIFESTLISPRSGLVPYKSGVWNKQQCDGLKQITEAIHKNGSYVSCQLFAPGRVANVDLMKQNGLPLLGVSSGLYHSKEQKEKALTLGLELEELTIQQIKEIQQDFVNAAFNAIHLSGFDMVEIHGTSGFLVEQFLSPLSNHRSDKYGGNIENRARFLLELLDLLFAHPDIGASRVGIRITPWSTHNGMEYPDDQLEEGHPALDMCEFIMREMENRKQLGNEVAYISITEPRVSGSSDAEPRNGWTNLSLVKAFTGNMIRSGGYATNYKGDPSSIKSNAAMVKNIDNEVVHYYDLIKDSQENDRTLFGFLRPFTSNPDFVNRIREGLELDPYNRKYFYTHTIRGYLNFSNYIPGNKSNEIILSDEELDRPGNALA